VYDRSDTIALLPATDTKQEESKDKAESIPVAALRIKYFSHANCGGCFRLGVNGEILV
jgi:hypothetical protein